MNEFPMVDRAPFSFSARLANLIFALICLAGPFAYLNAFHPSPLPVIQSTLETVVATFVSLLSGDAMWTPEAPIIHPRYVFASLAFFSLGFSLLYQALFKVDVTYTITPETIVRTQNFFVGSTTRTWPMSDVISASIKSRGRAVDVSRLGETDPSPTGDRRFRLEVKMRSGERLHLPQKRYYATVLRMKQAIDEVIGS
jgi:hypothetical protein